MTRFVPGNRDLGSFVCFFFNRPFFECKPEDMVVIDIKEGASQAQIRNLSISDSKKGIKHWLGKVIQIRA